MLTSTRVESPEILFQSSAATHSRSANHSSNTTSFAQQLADSLEAYLDQVQPGSHLQISISPAGSQNSGARQFLVTVREDRTAAASASAASAANAASTPEAVLTTRIRAAEATALAAVTAEPEPIYTDQKDAYWGAQPEAVQVLREMKDLNERFAKGWELAGQGYSIDTDIMIYHSDPWMTMAQRANRGYTWYPALGQSHPLQPGVQFPGMTPYIPSNPPAGSINVDMGMFEGLEHTSIWYVSPEDAAVS